MFGLSKKEKLAKAKIVHERDLESLKKLQTEVGNRIFDELQRAAEQNTNIVVYRDGEEYKEPYKLIIGKKVQNGKNGSYYYKITVSVDDPLIPTGTCLDENGNLVKGVAIYQIEVDMAKFGMELFMFKCPYGPDICIWDFSVAQLENFLEMARILTKGCRHYRPW